MKGSGNTNITIQAPAKARKGVHIQNLPGVDDFLNIHFTTANAMKMGNAKGYSMLFAGPSLFVGAQKCEDFVRFIKNTSFSGSYDYYVTANTFRKPNIRQEENVFGLCNIVLDIDCHCNKKDTGKLYTDCENLATLLASEFKFHAEKHLIPEMNSIVITGRGVQLWWAFDPIRLEYADCYDALVDYFSDVTNCFLQAHEQFQDFQLDAGASKNKTGLFRLPGTCNRKTGMLTKAIIVSHQVHSMFDCRKNIREVYTGTQKIRITPKAFRPAQLSQADDFAPVAFRRAISLEALVALRKGNMTGMRDFILWMYHNECSKCMDHKSAYNRMLAMNATFTEPLREKQCQNIISGTLNIASTRAPKGYALRNETIINLLGINEQEQKIINLFPAEEKQEENARYFELIRYYDSKLRTRKKLLTQLAGLGFMREGHSSVEAALVFGGGDRTWRTIRSKPESLYRRLQACENWILQVESMIRDRSCRLLTVMQQAEVFYSMVAKKSNINLATYPFQTTMPKLSFPQTIDGFTDPEAFLAVHHESAAATEYLHRLKKAKRTPKKPQLRITKAMQQYMQCIAHGSNRKEKNCIKTSKIDSKNTANGMFRLSTEYRVRNSSEAGVTFVPSGAVSGPSIPTTGQHQTLSAAPALVDVDVPATSSNSIIASTSVAPVLSDANADARLAVIGALAACLHANSSAAIPAATRPSELTQLENYFPWFKNYPWTQVQTEALHILDAELFDIHHDNMFLFADTSSYTDCFYDFLTCCLNVGRSAANQVLINGLSFLSTLQRFSDSYSFVSEERQQDQKSGNQHREQLNYARRQPTSAESSWETSTKKKDPFVRVWISHNFPKQSLPTQKQLGLVWHLLHEAKGLGNTFRNLSISNLTAREVTVLIDFLRYIVKYPPCSDEIRAFYDVNTILSYFERTTGFSGEAHFPYVIHKRCTPTSAVTDHSAISTENDNNGISA